MFPGSGGVKAWERGLSSPQLPGSPGESRHWVMSIIMAYYLLLFFPPSYARDLRIVRPERRIVDSSLRETRPSAATHAHPGPVHPKKSYV